MKIVSVISLTQLAITAMATPQEVFNSLYEGSSYETGDAPVDLQVNGDLPSYLQGSIIHNGCGSFSVGERSLSHVFGEFSLFFFFGSCFVCLCNVPCHGHTITI